MKQSSKDLVWRSMLLISATTKNVVSGVSSNSGFFSQSSNGLIDQWRNYINTTVCLFGKNIDVKTMATDITGFTKDAVKGLFLVLNTEGGKVSLTRGKSTDLLLFLVDTNIMKLSSTYHVSNCSKFYCSIFQLVLTSLNRLRDFTSLERSGVS